MNAYRREMEIVRYREQFIEYKEMRLRHYTEWERKIQCYTEKGPVPQWMLDHLEDLRVDQNLEGIAKTIERHIIPFRLPLNKSFAFHEKSRFWDYENNRDMLPKDAPLRGRVIHAFKCENGHSFKLRSVEVVEGEWCPTCLPRLHKTEKLLQKWLEKTYGEVICQYKDIFNISPVTGHHLPYDFALPNYKVIIELDGTQHFKQVWNWQSPEQQEERDRFKEDVALENGWSVIRVLQEDVAKNRNDWDDNLIYYIREYGKPKVIKLYDLHMGKRRL
jgi:hypothetical protein